MKWTGRDRIWVLGVNTGRTYWLDYRIWGRTRAHAKRVALNATNPQMEKFLKDGTWRILKVEVKWSYR